MNGRKAKRACFVFVLVKRRNEEKSKTYKRKGSVYVMWRDEKTRQEVFMIIMIAMTMILNKNGIGFISHSMF